VRIHQFRGQLVGRLRTHRHQLRRAFHQAQEVPVAWIARVRQQPVLVRIHQQAAGQQQGTRTTRRDQDTFRVQIHVVALPVESGDRRTQRRQAACSGVTGVASAERGLSGAHDGLCRGEVRLADLQMDHIVAGLLQRLSAGQQGHDMERCNVAAASAVACRGQ